MRDQCFTAELVRDFARLSGDYNPIHIDPIAARRTVTGHNLAHGLLLVFAALDRLPLAGPRRLRRLKASFTKPVPVGDTVSFSCAGDSQRVSLSVGGALRASVGFELMEAATEDERVLQQASSDIHHPLALAFEEAATREGSLPLHIDRVLCASLFPNATRLLPATQLAELLATTRLVGMECPGLHSLYSDFELQFEPWQGETELAYRVAKANPRYSKLEIEVKGPSARGRLGVFVRPAPAVQLSLSDAVALVRPHEFDGQRALVIGGSRGLGEVSAKLIAAGGGDVTIGYRDGADDASRIASDVVAFGGTARVAQIDVLDASQPWLEAVPRPTHLYYFATPSIAIDPKAPFSTLTFERYCRYYVAAFASIFEGLARDGLPLAALYPSTVFLDTRPPGTAEYVAAKSAGEVLCSYLGQKYPASRFIAPRLPRMRTDQTVGLAPAALQEAPEVMLALLRQLQGERLTPIS